jgi:choline dehydrogenase-like flavoprotein
VCAGAVGSAQLLLLSGIGPAAWLRSLGIGVVVDLPGVGENLQDHPVVMACYAAGSPLPASSYNHGEVYAALRSKLAGEVPDLHLFPVLLPVAPPGHRAPPAGFALMAGVMAPASRGSVRLASADPGQAPVIDPGFLRERPDVDRLEEGLGLVRRAGGSAAFTGLAGREVWPGRALRSSPAVRAYIGRTVSSYYHPVGTCRMGAVDPHLRVQGLAGLRVADGSVMPVIPNAHPNATVLAIAERAAELVNGRGSTGM